MGKDFQYLIFNKDDEDKIMNISEVELTEENIDSYRHISEIHISHNWYSDGYDYDIDYEAVYEIRGNRYLEYTEQVYSYDELSNEIKNIVDDMKNYINDPGILHDIGQIIQLYGRILSEMKDDDKVDINFC